MWGSAHHQDLDKTPTSGWENISGEFHIIWFNGEQMPPALIPEVEIEKKPDNAQGDCEKDNDADEVYDSLSRELESSDVDSDDDQERDDLL